MMATTNKKPLALGISASLRNARFGAGSDDLVLDLEAIDKRPRLTEYLSDQSKICLKSFIAAGRAKGLPFDDIYTNLQLNTGDRGLSNSEVALAAALWGVKNQGVAIRHVGIARHFPPRGPSRNLDELKEQLLRADGILLSGPVYFGDRGSLANSLIETIRDDSELRKRLRGKLYGGIAVGAKRNGGQETTLIYQMLDLTNLGFLAVGNDSDTTSQYGGTCKAGDVGSMAEDEYGLNTSIGVGNRLGHVLMTRHLSRGGALRDRLKVAVWILQDRQGYAREKIAGLVDRLQDQAVEFRIMDFTDEEIHRCIACDICPTHVDVDEVYRCIVKRKEDLFAREHSQLIDVDAILIACFSPRDRAGVKSVYQRFIERTRYLRRGDYVFSDMMVAPLILEEIGSGEAMHIRAMTSMIRHHTIMHHPLVGYISDNQIINEDDVIKGLNDFLEYAGQFTVGRLQRARHERSVVNIYNPVGYILSTEKHREDDLLARRRTAVDARMEKIKTDADERVLLQDKG